MRPKSAIALAAILATLAGAAAAAADTQRMTPGTPVANSSGNVANANAVATLAAASFNRTTYIQGFTCSSGGATAAGVVGIAVSGLLGGTETFPYGVPAGASSWNAGTWKFPTPLPASTTGTAIVVTMPALGAGNTNAACSAWGFQL